MASLPDLSRFELQCLRKLWDHREATVREIHQALDDPPSYSTVRKIIERLEEKGAVKRVGKRGRACTYRSAVPPPAMLRKEITRFLRIAFDGAAAPLVAHLAEMDELTLEDLREIESHLEQRGTPKEEQPKRRARGSVAGKPSPPARRSRRTRPRGKGA